ncbi:MAG TPA: DUF6152 family protein [Gammaproteobacteria bacterium]|nr:DUF6152 family protein [Gammaproteobacteria bacterium]
MSNRRAAVLCAVSFCAVLVSNAPRAWSHHSGAMFDAEKSLTLAGSVKEFQWTNPHCWIQLDVPAEGGGTEEWSVEMAAPLQLYQNGWRPGTLKPGDRISVVVHPMRDGTKGGLFLSAESLDGKQLGKQP